MDRRISVLMIDSGIATRMADEYRELYDGSIPALACGEPSGGHGTAVFGILRRSAEVADIYSLHIKGIEEGISEAELIQVLSYVLNCGEHFDIINLSLGISVCQHLGVLEEICDRLDRQGTILVSAFNNDGTLSYPAAMDTVIGVVSGSYCRDVHDIEFFEDKIVNVAAKGSIQRVAWNTQPYIFLGGNSFACAHVTNEVIRLFATGICDRKGILKAIAAEAICIHRNVRKNMTGRRDFYHSIPFAIHRACLFPFNKEMHSLIRFHEMLGFEIEGVYDSRYAMTVGSTTSHLLNGTSLKKRILNISTIDWDSFDTLILGHVAGENGKVMEIRDNLVLDALARGKNIYSFDALNAGNLYQGHVFVPNVSIEEALPFRYGMMYRIGRPVLGIYGTSSSQGKFTLQLNLRKRFLDAGYDVGQVGTEPSSLLFGMDYVVPMGYHSTVELRGDDLVCYLNSIINALSVKGKEIIITGAQAGSVIFEEGNLSRYNVDMYSFLLGTNPDAVVLCINPYDTVDYIRRTVNFLEASVDTKVIGIVVFPMTLKEGYLGIYGTKVSLEETEMEALKVCLYDAFQTPVYALNDDKDLDKLFYSIIEYFSDR